MTAPLSGRYASIRMGDTVINLLGHWEINTPYNIDTRSTIGSRWTETIPMMHGWNGNIDGFLDSSTGTDAQLLALLKPGFQRNKIQNIRFYMETSSGMYFGPNWSAPESTSYSTDAGIYIQNIRSNVASNDLVHVSLDFIGTGSIVLAKPDILLDETGEPVLDEDTGDWVYGEETAIIS